MQWDDSENAGFSAHEPWLPLEKSFKEKNVASELKDPSSMLQLYKTLLKMRQEFASVFIDGVFQTIEVNNPSLFAYQRNGDNQKYCIYINFSADKQKCELMPGGYRQLLSSVFKNKREDTIYSMVELEPNEAIIFNVI